MFDSCRVHCLNPLCLLASSRFTRDFSWQKVTPRVSVNTLCLFEFCHEFATDLPWQKIPFPDMRKGIFLSPAIVEVVVYVLLDEMVDFIRCVDHPQSPLSEHIYNIVHCFVFYWRFGRPVPSFNGRLVVVQTITTDMPCTRYGRR